MSSRRAWLRLLGFFTLLSLTQHLCAAQPTLLIEQVNFKNHPDWVKLRCLDDGNNGLGANLAGYYLTDLGAPDKIFGNATLKTGELLRVTYDSDLPDETTSSAGNGDGVLDLYTPTNGLVSTDEQAVVCDPTDTILDAVCWSDGILSAAETVDLSEVFQAGQWNSAQGSDCVDSTKVGAGYLIERISGLDSNTATDWQVSLMNGSVINESTGSAITDNLEQAATIEDLQINPNPFWLDDKRPAKRETVISFALNSDASVTAVIYDSSGRLIRHLQRDEQFTQGEIELRWRGRNEADNQVIVGIYLLYLKVVNNEGAAQKTVPITVARRP